MCRPQSIREFILHPSRYGRNRRQHSIKYTEGHGRETDRKIGGKNAKLLCEQGDQIERFIPNRATIKARGYIFRPNLLGSILKWGNMFHYSIENLFGNFRTMFLYALGFFTQTYWSPC